MRYLLIRLFFTGPQRLDLSLSITLPLMGIIRNNYRYLQDLLQLSACFPANPLPLTRGFTPIRLEMLLPYLQRHPDQHYAGYIFSGGRDGFRIGFNRCSSILKKASRNHPSTQDHSEVVTSHIYHECQCCRLGSPGPHHIQVSPIGLVPKPHVQDKWRLIVDLSSPRGHSVNDGISPSLCSLDYASIDDAVNLIMQLGPGTQLVKMDLSNAYRIVPVHPDDQPLLGITWQGMTYVDQALPFGLRSAPKIFTAVADFLAWVLFCEGTEFLLHYTWTIFFSWAPLDLVSP